MELKIIMHHRICRPNAKIQLFCTSFDHHSYFKESVPISFFILCTCGCGWMTWVLHMSHTHAATFKHSVHSYTTLRYSTVPKLRIHVLINLFTWYTFCPQKNAPQTIAPPWFNSQVSLARSPLHSNSHTNFKVNRLGNYSHDTLKYSWTPPLPLFPLSSKI
jgi:hypothetical protein